MIAILFLLGGGCALFWLLKPPAKQTATGTNPLPKLLRAENDSAYITSTRRPDAYDEQLITKYYFPKESMQTETNSLE